MHHEKENYEIIDKNNNNVLIKNIYDKINFILFDRQLEFEYDKIFIFKFIISHINNYYSKKLFNNIEIVDLIEKEVALFKEILTFEEIKNLDSEIKDTIFYHQDISLNVFLYLINKTISDKQNSFFFEQPIIPFFKFNEEYKKEILKISKFDSNVNNANILAINKESFKYEIFQMNDFYHKNNEFDILIVKNNITNGKYYLFERINNQYEFKYSYMSNNFKNFLDYIISNKTKHIDAISFFKSINILSYSVQNHDLLMNFLDNHYENEIKLIKINHYNSGDDIDHFLFPESNLRTIYNLKNIISKISSLYNINNDWLFLSVYYNFIFKKKEVN